MEVSSVVDLKSVIDEMDYDCRKKDPVHYNNIINNLKNLHSLCKTEEDRELFTTYLSAATSPVVMADLIQAELNTVQDNIKNIATEDIVPTVQTVVESANELKQMQANVTPEPEMVAKVTGTNKDDIYPSSEMVAKVTGTNKDDMYPQREVVARVTGTNKDDYIPSTMPVQSITDEFVIPNIENVEEGKSR